jgi:hypothetical protein
MDSKRHAAFTGAPAKIDPRVGGGFAAWGPHIRGVNVELIKNKRIVQAWRTLKLAGGPLLHRHVRPQAGKVRDGAGFHPDGHSRKE